MMYKKFKRLFDFVLSIVLLALFFPILLIVAIMVKLRMGGDVLFKQERPGLNCKSFIMYKFRSMCPKISGSDLSDEERITGLGRLLRSTSLDELPELINVLKGEMSLVGPRPLLVDYLASYTTEQNRRHEVRPGITGLAQVRGRNNLSWKNKFRYDVFYVEKCGFVLDIMILAQTVKTVFTRAGFKIAGESLRFDETK